MLDMLVLPETLQAPAPPADIPSELFRAHERIRELERDVLGLRSELVVRRKQAADAADELARYRRAFQGGWRTLKVMRNKAREAMQECHERLAELDEVPALRARVAELEAGEARFAEIRRELEAEAARWREEADLRLELQEFLGRQVEAQRERADALEARMAEMRRAASRGLLKGWRAHRPAEEADAEGE